MAKRIRLASRKKAPCGPADAQGAWRRLAWWFQHHFPEALDDQPGGATDEQIRVFEEAIGRTLPEEVRQSFLVRDGLHGGIFSIMDFLSLQESLRDWTFCKNTLRDDEFYRFVDSYFRERSTTFPNDSIRPGFINLNWIPLVTDVAGNHIGIDLDPGPQGIPGQVITFGNRQYDKVVLAWTWGWFLNDLADEVERGNFRLVEDDGLELRLRDPPVEHFFHAAEGWSKAKTGGRRPPVNWAIDSTWLEWNGETMVRLARSITEEGAFDRLPIIGDALEEAGCIDPAILVHCRQPPEHGCSCWLVDSLLGRG